MQAQLAPEARAKECCNVWIDRPGEGCVEEGDLINVGQHVHEVKHRRAVGELVGRNEFALLAWLQLPKYSDHVNGPVLWEYPLADELAAFDLQLFRLESSEMTPHRKPTCNLPQHVKFFQFHVA